MGLTKLGISACFYTLALVASVLRDTTHAASSAISKYVLKLL